MKERKAIQWDSNRLSEGLRCPSHARRQNFLSRCAKGLGEWEELHSSNGKHMVNSTVCQQQHGQCIAQRSSFLLREPKGKIPLTTLQASFENIYDTELRESQGKIPSTTLHSIVLQNIYDTELRASQGKIPSTTLHSIVFFFLIM